MGSTNGQLQASIIPVSYRKGAIVKQNITLFNFANNFYLINQNNGNTITRRDVEWYWESNVRFEFDTADPAHNRLISQIRSPKFETFWLNKTAVATVQAKRVLHEQEGFWPVTPNITERKHFKNAIILGNGMERWIIPNVALMAVEDVSFQKFVQEVRKVNADRASDELDKSKLFRLWGALIKKGYDFVPKEVQNEKLKEAFSRHPPTTEEGLQEFYGMPSKKRKSAPISEGKDSDGEHSGKTQKRKRVSIGDSHIREFDDDSILDPILKPILKSTYEPPSRSIGGSSASTSSRSSAGADSGKAEDDMVDQREKRIPALEKELAELKLERDEVEHKLQSERGRREAAEKGHQSLQADVQELLDLVARLGKRST